MHLRTESGVRVNPWTAPQRRHRGTLDAHGPLPKNRPMGQPRSRRSVASRPGRLLACALVAAFLTASGCALLIPPSWRGRAPVPLAGPIATEGADPAAGERGPLEPSQLSDERLALLIDADQERLVELASRSETAPGERQRTETELREIADRLPRLQHELDRRRGEASRATLVR